LENGNHVGACGLRPYNIKNNIFEIGFHICSSQWGKGYATEAARRVMKYAFKNLKISGLFAGHNPKNEASRQLLIKLGFRYTHDEYYEPTGLKHPSYLLTVEDYTT
jgi:RimJ/RimL family protein N-acetyltransferase